MVPYEAIYKRKSVRRFLMEPLSERELSALMKYEKNLIAQDPSILTKMEILDNTVESKKKKSKAPYYLVIYSEKKEGWLSNAGCLLEQMVLYLTSKGIGTVYLGNARPDKVMEGNLHYVIMVAFGKPAEEVHRPSWKAKRKALSAICTQKEELNSNLASMLEAARLAPSALNRQPWFFEVFQRKIRIYYRKNSRIKYISRIDEISMGIMLAHLLIAAEELWVDVVLHRPDQIPKGKMPYFLTLSFRKEGEEEKGEQDVD